jgi:hypothetical protein
MSNQRKKPNKLESTHFQNNKRIFKRVKNKEMNKMLTKLFIELASWHTLQKIHIPHVHQLDKTCFYLREGSIFLACMLGSAPCSKNINGGPIKWLLLK